MNKFSLAKVYLRNEGKLSSRKMKITARNYTEKKDGTWNFSYVIVCIMQLQLGLNLPQKKREKKEGFISQNLLQIY